MVRRGCQAVRYRFAGAVRGFFQDGCVDRASLLAYTTLLALVPVVALMFSLWNAIGFGEDRRALLDHYILQSFVPRVGSTVLQYISVLGSRGDELGLFGACGLVFTEILLIHEVERHFNAIWGEKIRCQLCRPVRYLFLMVAGPAGMALLMLLLLDPVQWAFAHLARLPRLPGYLDLVLAFFTQTAMLVLLYQILPAARVRLVDAFTGAVTAAVLLSLSRAVLAIYLHYSFTAVLYGTLGMVPVFLIWLYLVWLSVLFGAEMAAAGRETPPAVDRRG